MPLIPLTLGVENDRPMIGAEPFVWRGVNIRVRAGYIETLGLYGPVRSFDAADPNLGPQIQLPGAGVYRSAFTTPSTTTGQVLFGSNTNVSLLEYDPSSTVNSGRRWSQFDVTPASLPPAQDTLTEPNSGRVEIPPTWWFADISDTVVGQRADVDTEGPYFWDRDRLGQFEPIPASPHPDGTSQPTPVPRGAVGGGIINRILVLLGCEPFDRTSSGPGRFLTVRWSQIGDFGQWTPFDTTVSGEIQLEGGSLIVGGGVVSFGVAVWTDKRMAILQETFDDDVFARRYIDGGRGLLANRAWCEADGQVWWLDEARTLNVFDGGRPRQIINTNKLSSIDRLTDSQAARIYLTPNQEFGEVVITYPNPAAPGGIAQLVYNYLYNCWYPWQVERTAWYQRIGVIDAIAVDSSGRVFQHDFDVALPQPWATTAPDNPSADDVTPYSWSLDTNLITQASPGYSSWASTRVTLDKLYSAAEREAGEDPDTFNLTVTGYRNPVLTSEPFSETQEVTQTSVIHDFRVGGKAVQISMSGTMQQTVWRFGMIDIAGQVEGER